MIHVVVDVLGALLLGFACYRTGRIDGRRAALRSCETLELTTIEGTTRYRVVEIEDR